MSEDQDLDSIVKEANKATPKKVVVDLLASAHNAASLDYDEGQFLEQAGLRKDHVVPPIKKPWMEHHKFTGVTTIEQANEVVDKCIEAGYCALDLETEGLDNRIVWNEDGTFETVHKIVGYCISYDGYEGFYLPVGHVPEDGGPSLNLPWKETGEAITRLCRAAIPDSTPEMFQKDPLSYKIDHPPKVVIAFWNAQFDHEFLYPITGIDWWHPESFEDGMLASFVKYAGDKGIGLKPKAEGLLRDPDGNPYEMIAFKDLFPGRRSKKNLNFATLSPDEIGVLRYTGSDAICTYLLCKLPSIVPLVRAKHKDTYRLEKQTSCTLRGMERNRVSIVQESIKEMLDEQTSKREELIGRINAFADKVGWSRLDPNSPKQLSEFLFTSKGINLNPKPEKNEASGQFKTDEATLSALAKNPGAPPILKDIVAFRGVEKFIGTYLTSLSQNTDSNGEIRVSFKQTGAGTGRFSAPAGRADHGYSGIPIHGIPGGSELRRAFRARPGYSLAKCDYAAEELRIAANVSGEKVWVDEFLHGEGDLHSITARAFFGKQEVSKDERSAGKTANFALLYGGGPQAIIRATGCDQLEARRRKAAFDKAVNTFSAWIKAQHKVVEKKLGVTTAFGRWLSIPDAKSPDPKIRAACQRHAVNYQIQGAGADIMKISLVLLHKEFYKRGWLKTDGDDSVRMLLTVHDEVVCEIRNDRIAEAIPIIVAKMESPWRLPKYPKWQVPLVVEPLLGFNWASGFDAKRVPEGYTPTEDEVVLNGFAYSTIRKPKVDKQGNVIERLDEQEQAVTREGKPFFQVINAPWLCGHEPGSVNNPPPQPPEVTEEHPEIPPPEDDTSEEEVVPTVLPPPPSTEPDPQVEFPKPPKLPTEVGSDETLHLRIERLNEHTAHQMVDFIMISMEAEGQVLHVTDVLGETLVSPELRIRVNQEALISHLSEYNLIVS